MRTRYAISPNPNVRAFVFRLIVGICGCEIVRLPTQTAKLVVIRLTKASAVFLCQPLQHAALRKCRQCAAVEPEQNLVFFAAGTIDHHEAVVKTIIIRHLVHSLFLQW